MRVTGVSGASASWWPVVLGIVNGDLGGRCEQGFKWIRTWAIGALCRPCERGFMQTIRPKLQADTVNGALGRLRGGGVCL